MGVEPCVGACCCGGCAFLEDALKACVIGDDVGCIAYGASHAFRDVEGLRGDDTAGWRVEPENDGVMAGLSHGEEPARIGAHAEGWCEKMVFSCIMCAVVLHR